MALFASLLLLAAAAVAQVSVSVNTSTGPDVQGSQGVLNTMRLGDRQVAPQPAATVLGKSGNSRLGQRQEAAVGLGDRADAPDRLRGGRRDDYEEEYDDDDDDDVIMDVSGTARLKTDEQSEKMHIFLKDIEKLYSRGFRRSHALRSKKSRDGWVDVVHIARHDEQLMAADQASQDKNATQLGETTLKNVVLAGRKVVNLSTLPYAPKNPFLTVQIRDLSRDDKVSFYASVAFEEQVGFHWFLNGRAFDEYDSMQTVDMKSYVDPTTNKTVHSRVSLVEVEHLLKLPTVTGKYEIICNVTVDFLEKEVKYALEPQLTDDCPPANCYDRHAICRTGKCVCDSPYPVRLNSVHTTCRTESFLETPCHHHDQCLFTTNNSECIDQGWCACQKGYGRTPQHLCVKKVGVNSRCDSDANCKSFNASCILSHCTCNSDSVEENDRCIVISRSVNRLHSGVSSLRPWWLQAASMLALVTVLGGHFGLLGS